MGAPAGGKAAAPLPAVGRQGQSARRRHHGRANGALTVRADNTANPAINEWDADLIHGKH